MLFCHFGRIGGCQERPLLRDSGFTQMWFEDWAGEKRLPNWIIGIQLLS